VLIASTFVPTPATSLDLAAKLNVFRKKCALFYRLGFIFLYMLERLLAVKKVRSGNTWKYERHSTGGFLRRI